ncbi:MAG: hypothetical protein AB7I33_15255 [Gemmatimonadales bacterium]
MPRLTAAFSALLLAFPCLLHAQSTAIGPRVVPVYLVPADMEFQRPRLALAIQALEHVRDWYGRVLRGRTFAYDPVVVQVSSHVFDEFAADSFQAWWPLLQAEFSGYGQDWEDDRTKMLWIAHGAGAWAGADSENGGLDSIPEAGRVPAGNLGGLAVIGDSTLGGYLAGVCPDSGRTGSAWWCSWYTFQGTVAHELGHTWGLPHPDAFLPGFRCADSTAWTNMQCHWGFPFDSLLPWEQVHLRSLSYFQYRPGASPRLLAEERPLVGHAVAHVFERGTPLLWMDGRGGGTGYPWGLEVQGSVIYRLRPDDSLFAADVGTLRGAGPGSIQILLDGVPVFQRDLTTTSPPLPVVLEVRGRRRLEVRSQGRSALGNPRVYPGSLWAAGG